jgi:hypothetical protein
MKTFTQFSETIDRLLGGARCVRITVDGYMPLVAEEIGPSAEGRRLVALAHTGVQNGDVMHDPEIVFEFHAFGAEPISFRNDYVGAHDEVYAYDDAGRRTGVYAKRRAELVSFARIWFRNLRAQGFLGEGAHREVIA